MAVPLSPPVYVTAYCAENMSLLLRIPSWASPPTVVVNGSVKERVIPGELFPVACSGFTYVKATFNRTVRVERRYNNAVSVYHG